MMTDRQQPKRGGGAQNATARRKAREAEALRANLRRRKDQARGRNLEEASKESNQAGEKQ